MSLTAQTIQAMQTAVREVVREEVMFEVANQLSGVQRLVGVVSRAVLLTAAAFDTGV